MSTQTEERERKVRLRALEHHEDWATCDHAGAGGRSHSCPKCGATMRRCCDSAVGPHAHTDQCQEPRGTARD